MNYMPIFQEAVQASQLQLTGAACFGALIGWYVYFINRYRKVDVQFSDLVTVLGVIGGSAVLALFPSGTDLFGAYGLGLAIGFFGYFLILLIMVGISNNFNVDWFLDGRRILPDGDIFVPQIDSPAVGGRAMGTSKPPAAGKQ